MNQRCARLIRSRTVTMSAIVSLVLFVDAGPESWKSGGASAETAPAGAPHVCVGDCDGSGEIRINELIVGVNITLGIVSLSACPAFDCPQRVGNMFINCAVDAVNNALVGCLPTPTPTVTPTPLQPSPTTSPQPTTGCEEACDGRSCVTEGGIGGNCLITGETGECQCVLEVTPTATP